MAIDVAIVEDDDRLRAGLQTILNGTAGYACHQAYSSAERALEGLMRRPAEVVLMDISLKNRDGVWCTERLYERSFAGQVLIMSVYDDEDVVFRALQAGASGYILKDAPPTAVLEAIREIRSGGSPMSASIARMVIRHFRELRGRKAARGNDMAQLSRRERELVECVMRGGRYGEIAEGLGISVNTVKGHIRNIYDKLQVTSRGELMAKLSSRNGE